MNVIWAATVSDPHTKSSKESKFLHHEGVNQTHVLLAFTGEYMDPKLT